MFDAIESGVEDELCIGNNVSAFSSYKFLPRGLIDVSVRDQSSSLFNKDYACPFGIAPTGAAGLFRRGSEQALAGAAEEADIPMIVSGASIATMEEVVRVPEKSWFQVYCARDRAISEKMIDRAEAAGFDALVITIDNPVTPNRERDARNGFSLPPKLKFSSVVESLRHPAWIAEYLVNGGMPLLGNWAPYSDNPASGKAVAAFFRSQSPSIQTWKDLDWFRSRWKGKLVVKGIMHPGDATQAVEAGADGVIISNHGGKSLDCVPAPVDLVPAVKSAVKGRVPTMMDGGIRRGSNIVAALCLGADFVFVGRATLYGAVAAGRAGVDKAIAILRSEVDTTLGLLGCRSIRDLGRHFLWNGDMTEGCGPDMAPQGARVQSF